MTSKEKKEIKKLISNEIESIKKTIAELEELTKPVPQDGASDWFSSKESNSSRSINEAALEKARIHLSVLYDTLMNVDNPNFGICSKCRKPIPLARIKALPTTNTCIRCAIL